MPRQEAADAQSRRAQGAQVAASVFEMRLGAGEPVGEDGTRGLGRSEQRRGVGAGGAQFIGGQVAAACAQVGGGVAQDIHELEALAVADAEAGQLGRVQRRVAWQMLEAEPGPEFADAAGDEVGVFVERRGVRQRDDAGGIGETLQVQRLAADDLREHGGDLRAVRGGERGEPVERFAEAREEFRLAGMGGAQIALERGKAVARAGGNHLAEGREMLEAQGRRRIRGIGDGVAGAREQVGEADGRAQCRGQDADGEVKRARDAREQRPAEIARAHGVGATERSSMRPSSHWPRPSAAAVWSHSARFAMGGSLASTRQPSMSRAACASSATGSRLA